MGKSRRLIELMMAVNRMRRFTVRELAEQFEVSQRTMLRDLQELSALGVPLYSEVGPHGGYQVLSERVLPPIAFTEEEAAAMFFASHALRHYRYLPFEDASASALTKFYNYMSSDVRDRIDQMKNRVDFFTPLRSMREPKLNALLQAAVDQQVLAIEYESRSGKLCRDIQPIGIYASNGLWYCPAYCFTRNDIRLFRCDRIRLADHPPTAEPRDLTHVHLGNWRESEADYAELLYVVELTREGVQRCETELYPIPAIQLREDGSGRLSQLMPASELSYFAAFFVGLGLEAQVLEPPALLEAMRELLLQMTRRYGLHDEHATD